MLGRIFRVLSGFLIACLAAGLTKVLFAFSPAELSNLPPEIAGDRLQLALPIATHMAIFSAPFALVGIWLAEWQRWRDWTYYVVAGILIAGIGFAAQYNSESATMGWSILSSNYPAITFLTTGFVGGLAYWLFSGRLAGHHLLSTHGRHGVGGHHDHGGDKTKKPAATTTTTVKTSSARH